MIFTVVWLPTAEAELARIWNTAADRDAVAAAADRIDAALRRDAPRRGESRSGSARVYFDWPLGVDFDVDEDDRIVRVLAVWRMVRRDPAG